MKYLLFALTIIAFSCETEQEGPILDTWHEIDMVDKFGEKVPGKTIFQYITKGSFDNSTAVNQDAFAVFMIHEGVMTVKVFNYGLDQPAPMPENYNDAYVYIRNNERQLYYPLNSTGNSLMDLERKLLDKMLEEATVLKMIIEVDAQTGGKSNYLFSVDTRGLFGTS